MAGWGSQALINPACRQFYDKSKGIHREKTGYVSYDIHDLDDPDYRKALILLDLLKLDYVKLTERLWAHAWCCHQGTVCPFLDDSDERKQCRAQSARV
ncbi:MAG: hypothetical protein QM270_10295 [Bacillota bacterium]|nr:hypothetical protein [Bacillota bacterium]